jgi:lysozyme
LQFLIAREGNVSSMYNDNAGHCTVGVGHLVHLGGCEFGKPTQRHSFEIQPDPHAGMTPGQVGHWDSEKPFFSRLSQEKVLEMLHHDIQTFEAAVNKAITVELTQAQFDALVSFCFNVGARAFSHSTLVTLINQRKFDDAALQFGKWVKSNGKLNAGLVNRRSYEQTLFAKGDYQENTHPIRHGKRPRHKKHKPHHASRGQHAPVPIQFPLP